MAVYSGALELGVAAYQAGLPQNGKISYEFTAKSKQTQLNDAVVINPGMLAAKEIWRDSRHWAKKHIVLKWLANKFGR